MRKQQSVMFDIDDTLISSRTNRNIQWVVDLLNRCRKQGFRIVIVTARPSFPTNVNWTYKQLKDHGIHYDELWFCPAEMKGKAKRDSGYNFWLSVGDQPTDLTDSTYSIKV